MKFVVPKKGHSMTLKMLFQFTASIRNILCGNYCGQKNRIEREEIIQWHVDTSKN